MTDSKKGGIAIDSWKLPIFDRHLRSAGYEYENKGRLLNDTLLLMVNTTNLLALGEVVKAANAEAARTGEPPAHGLIGRLSP